MMEKEEQNRTLFPPKEQRIAKIVLFLNPVIYGSTFIITKTVTQVIPTFFYMTMRYVIGCCLFLPFFLMKKYRELEFKETRKRTIKLAFIGGVLFFLANSSQTVGLRFTTASKTGIITGLNVILVPIFLALFFKRRTRKELWIGILLVIGGVVLMNFVRLGEEGFGLNVGDLIVFVAAVSFAIYIIVLEKRLEGLDNRAFACFQLIFIACFSLATSLLFDDWSYIFGSSASSIFTLLNWVILLYMGIIATGATFFIHVYGQKRIAATPAAIILALEPLFGVLFGMIGGETLSLFSALGIALMFLGILISIIRNAEEKKE
ncbi:MAG: DMT family transporter, partial [Candidatus Hodarchaeota archaeon]